jgi:phage-related protein
MKGEALMKWKIDFYNTKLKEEIRDWPVGIRAKFWHIAELIEDFGPYEVKMPHVKPIGQGLSEIRAKGQEGIGRALFCIEKKQVIIVLNCFIKKTEKAPQHEIEIARARMKEVKRNG